MGLFNRNSNWIDMDVVVRFPYGSNAKMEFVFQIEGKDFYYSGTHDYYHPGDLMGKGIVTQDTFRVEVGKVYKITIYVKGNYSCDRPALEFDESYTFASKYVISPAHYAAYGLSRFFSVQEPEYKLAVKEYRDTHPYLDFEEDDVEQEQVSKQEKEQEQEPCRPSTEVKSDEPIQRTTPSEPQEELKATRYTMRSADDPSYQPVFTIYSKPEKTSEQTPSPKFTTSSKVAPVTSTHSLKIPRKSLYSDNRDAWYVTPYNLCRLVDYISKGRFEEAVPYVVVNKKVFGVIPSQLMDTIASFLVKKMSVNNRWAIFGKDVKLDTKADFIAYFHRCGYDIHDGKDMSYTVMNYYKEKYSFKEGEMIRKPNTPWYDNVKKA